MPKAFLLCIYILTCSEVRSQCRELFISEYFHGSSTNRGLEIYNPSDSAINLNQYRITCWQNGATTWVADLSDTLDGIIAPNTALLILPDVRDTANMVADSVIRTEISSRVSIWAGKNNRAMDFDGDDAISLDRYGAGIFQPVDIIGKIGERPEFAGQTGGFTGWSDSFPFHTGMGTVYTKNCAIRRMPHVRRGVNVNPSFFDPAKEWLRFDPVIADSLATHSGSCNKFPAGFRGAITESAKLFPNPVNDRFYVQSEFESGVAEITGTDGRVYQNIGNFSTVKGSLEFQVQALPAGLYRVVLVDATKTISLGFIKL